MTHLSTGETRFTSSSRNITIAYQRSYKTGLIYNEKPVNDRPDIVIDHKGKSVIVIDAKNSQHRNLDYREKMDSYLNSSKTKNAVVIHSKVETKKLGLWEKAEENNGRRIFWTHLIPPTKIGNESKYNDENLQHVINLLFNSI